MSNTFASDEHIQNSKFLYVVDSFFVSNHREVISITLKNKKKKLHLSIAEQEQNQIKIS